MPMTTGFSTIRHEIAGVPVGELARRYGTPVFVYDAAKIAERIHDLRSFDTVRFAMKACSNIAILDHVRRSGALVDAVSAGEVERALAAGFAPHGDPPPIIYTADIFDADSLSLAKQHGLHVNCGSPDMIDQWGAVAPGSEITLRINPGFGHGHSQKTNTGGPQSKHGIWHEQIGDCLLRADHHGLSVTGLHLHIGSGSDLEHLSQVCQSMEKLALEVGRSLRSISAGGGLPIPYEEGDETVDLDIYYQLWDAARSRLADEFGHTLRLEIEPGRYVTGESGFLVSEIRAVKQTREHTFYLVDAGFNNLARPVLYGAYHPMSIVPGDGDTAQRPELDVVVGGPLCESGDIFTQSAGGLVRTRTLPSAAVGEYLVIECAGAYCASMGSNYNSKPLAAEVLVRDGQTHLIRQRQSAADLIRGESIPPGPS